MILRSMETTLGIRMHFLPVFFPPFLKQNRPPSVSILGEHVPVLCVFNKDCCECPGHTPQCTHSFVYSPLCLGIRVAPHLGQSGRTLQGRP